MMEERRFKVSYDERNGLLYLTLDPPVHTVCTTEIDDIFVFQDANGEFAGLKILDFTERLGAEVIGK